MDNKSKDEEFDDANELEEYDIKEEKNRIKSLGLEDSSKKSFNLLTNYHEKFVKEEEERLKKQKDEKKPFLL